MVEAGKWAENRVRYHVVIEKGSDYSTGDTEQLETGELILTSEAQGTWRDALTGTYGELYAFASGIEREQDALLDPITGIKGIGILTTFVVTERTAIT